MLSFACSRRVVFLSALVIVAFGASRSYGAPAEHLVRMDVKLWPEYDRPAMLVMLEGELPAATAWPATVVVTIPAAVGNPHAVAKRGPDGKLYMAKFERTVSGDWAKVAITTDRPVFRLEFYAPLDRSKPQRTYAFRWPAPPKIDKLSFVVQSPMGASALALKPPATDKQKDGRGLDYHHLEAGAHGAGKEIRLDVSYTNSSGALTKQMLGVRTPAPAAAPTPTPAPGVAPAQTEMAAAAATGEKEPPRTGLPTWVIVLLGAIGGLGAIAGAIIRSKKA